MILHIYDEHRWGEYTVVAFMRNDESVSTIRDWCCKTYGEPGFRWKDYISYGEVHLKNKEDLAFFKLRWE